MPRYDYECDKGHKIELIFPIGPNLPPTELYCRDCMGGGEGMKRKYNAVGFIQKIRGWSKD